MRDRVVSGIGRLDEATSVASRDLRNRARGVAHEGRARFGRKQKCIDVAAPVGQVFETFSQLERFPEFMTHVREVRALGDGTSQWTVAGPAGRTISWEAVTTRLEPNRIIAWRTLPGSAVEHVGLLRFEPDEGGTTATGLLRWRIARSLDQRGHSDAIRGKAVCPELGTRTVRDAVIVERGQDDRRHQPTNGGRRTRCRRVCDRRHVRRRAWGLLRR